MAFPQLSARAPSGPPPCWRPPCCPPAAAGGPTLPRLARELARRPQARRGRLPPDRRAARGPLDLPRHPAGRGRAADPLDGRGRLGGRGGRAPRRVRRRPAHPDDRGAAAQAAAGRERPGEPRALGRRGGGEEARRGRQGGGGGREGADRRGGAAGAAAGGRVAEVPGHLAGEEGRAREGAPRARGLRRVLPRRDRDRARRRGEGRARGGRGREVALQHVARGADGRHLPRRQLLAVGPRGAAEAPAGRHGLAGLHRRDDPRPHGDGGRRPPSPSRTTGGSPPG